MAVLYMFVKTVKLTRLVEVNKLFNTFLRLKAKLLLFHPVIKLRSKNYFACREQLKLLFFISKNTNCYMLNFLIITCRLIVIC